MLTGAGGGGGEEGPKPAWGKAATANLPCSLKRRQILPRGWDREEPVSLFYISVQPMHHTNNFYYPLKLYFKTKSQVLQKYASFYLWPPSAHTQFKWKHVPQPPSLSF